jgi:SAM-dependent methyltransferase
MTAPKPLDYAYTRVLPTWDHSIILPPIVEATRSIPHDGAVLDIGCGNGALLAEIRKQGSWRLCGIESSESAVSLARGQGFDVRLGDATIDPVTLFEPHSFDLIVSATPTSTHCGIAGTSRSGRGPRCRRPWRKPVSTVFNSMEPADSRISGRAWC